MINFYCQNLDHLKEKLLSQIWHTGGRGFKEFAWLGVNTGGGEGCVELADMPSEDLGFGGVGRLYKESAKGEKVLSTH